MLGEMSEASTYWSPVCGLVAKLSCWCRLSVREDGARYDTGWGQLLAMTETGYLEAWGGPLPFRVIECVELSTKKIKGGLAGRPKEIIDISDAILSELRGLPVVWEIGEGKWSVQSAHHEELVKVIRIRNPFGPEAWLELVKPPSVKRLLATKPAVVVERLARRADRRHWYHCRDGADLERVAQSLAPRSVVSFFFDERLSHAKYSSAVRSEILKLIELKGAVFVGALVNSVFIKGKSVVGAPDLDELATSFDADSEIFFGMIPSPDCDDVPAVAVTLPDGDFVFRNDSR
jgi:hypothetical protein